MPSTMLVAAPAPHRDAVRQPLGESGVPGRSGRTPEQQSAGTRDPALYLIDPHRIVYAHGGIYLLAWVDAYGAVRTFALERIHAFALTGEVFERRALPSRPFGNSLGVNTAPAEEVVIEFTSAAAPCVREREWHESQRFDDIAGGGVRVTLHVATDYALRAWVLGFGPDARVLSPVRFAQEIFDAVDETRRAYRSALPSRPMLRASA